MSAHFSKFGLNTYAATPYFQSQLPKDYPLSLILQKCRAFRRLPPNLKELAALAKRWAERTRHSPFSDIELWYDAAGNELDPDTGRRMIDAEIDAGWQADPTLARFVVRDVPVPPGGFADPGTWEKPESPGGGPDDAYLPLEQIAWDVRVGGRKRAEKDYGVEAVARALGEHGG